ncbi:hypothetical protein [Cerasicoccus maritimus]|uniref:hypothetical protein n=1 Tax=Cerasicoccus maritimus TaxID=490089 RepID=UPI002852A0C3|nr:hypothetical protein [Cerasicoccus maritimus]
MINHKFTYLLFVVIVSISGRLFATDGKASASDQWELRSEWWPQFVNLAEPVNLKEGDKTLREGRRGVLVRVEGEVVVVDFGRFGVQRLPIASTNFAELFAEESATRKWTDHGLFTKSYGSRFYHPEGWVQFKQKDIVVKDYFLIAYADLDTVDGRLGMVVFDDNLLGDWSLSKTQPLFIPQNIAPEEAEKLNDQLVELKIQTPTMPSFLADGHVTAFAHKPSDFTAVLIDKNGRVIGRYEIESTKDIQAWRSELEQAIREDRKSLSQESAQI